MSGTPKTLAEAIANALEEIQYTGADSAPEVHRTVLKHVWDILAQRVNVITLSTDEHVQVAGERLWVSLGLGNIDKEPK